VTHHTGDDRSAGNAPAAGAPPKTALWLADRLVDGRMRDAVVGDLTEAYGERVDALGPGRARRWFWRQALLAIAHFPARPRVPHTRGDGLMFGFVHDLSRAARTLRRVPTFTIACAITLGIGIGAATAIFSVADPVILRPLPYPSPERLFSAWERDDHGARSNLGFATIMDVRASATSLEQVAAVGGWAPTLIRDGSAEMLSGLRVSSNYFAAIGVQPAIGRGFAAEEDVQARNGVVIVSHAFWQTRLSGDSAVVGGTVDISGRGMLLAGVMPADYDDVLQPGTQIWRVLGYEASLPFACRTCRHLRMIARLRPNVTPAAALAELDVISARLVHDNPSDYPAAGFYLVQVQEDVTRAVRPALTALLVAVALLLIIATVNVGGLQLARALQRDEEFSIRTALGAGSGRLTRQLLAEGLVLAVVAGVTGWIFAIAGVGQLVHRLPASMPRLAAVHLDVRALGLALVTTLTTGIVIGLVPAWHARRRGLALSLRGARRAGGAPHRLRATLVVTEVALAVVLLAGAGLLARSLTRLLSVDAGVELATVATSLVQVNGARYADNAVVWAWQDQVVDAARAIPGVESAALASQLPLGGNVDSYGVQARDKPLANPALAPSADRYTVTTDFLRTMRIPMLDGRDFEAADNAPSAAPVAIISEALAKRIWPGERAVGKDVHLGEDARPWFTVIGVAGNVHHQGLDVGATLQIYMPTRRFFFADNAVDVVVRTAGDPSLVLSALRRAVTSADPATVVTRLATMREVVATSTAQRRLALTLFSAFAVIALLLAAAGIFGALAGTVAERRREIGLRSALGATPGGIVRLIVGQGAVLATTGITVGLVGALVGTRAIQGMLFGVGPRDVVTIAGVIVVIGIAAVAASAIPAWRAVRVDPITALRSE
jgi:putative ABC transport system permease protein